MQRWIAFPLFSSIALGSLATGLLVGRVPLSPILPTAVCGDCRHLCCAAAEIFTPDGLGELYRFPLEAHELGRERVLLPARAARPRRV